MLPYAIAVYFLLAERLGGVILEDDDTSDNKGLLDLWWSAGCNERSGCKNWMRGVWTAETQFEAGRLGVSLAEAASSQATWVHDDSDAPTTAQHGWVAFKIEYENHVVLLEHELDGEQPECHPNGLVKVSSSFLNGRLIQPGSVLLVEQCEQADGGSVEHFGTVTRVHHDGTHVHVNTDPMTHAEVTPLIRGGSASLLLPLADEVVAHDASDAARQFFENNQFFERGSLQRVVRTAKELDTEQHGDPTKDSPQKKELATAFETVTAAVEQVPADIKDRVKDILADQLAGLSETEAGKVIKSYKDALTAAADKAAGKVKEMKQAVEDAKTLFKGKVSFGGSFSKSAEAKTEKEGDDGKIAAGVKGEVTGAYKVEAQCGATLIAELVWSGNSITGFKTGVKGTAGLSLNANASVDTEAYFHGYLLNFIELNMGVFLGPLIKLAIKPIVTLDVIASAEGTANLTAKWEGEMQLGNDAKATTDDNQSVTGLNVTSIDEVKERTTWKFDSTVQGYVNAGIKMSVVFTAGVVAHIAEATASVSATMGAEFEGSFTAQDRCAQFQLTSHAAGTLKASFLFWAWSRSMTLSELGPIKLCGPNHNEDCVWQLDDPTKVRKCAKPTRSMLQAAANVGAINSGFEFDDYDQFDDYSM